MNERPNTSNTESLRDRLTREQMEHTARERSKHHAQALRDTTRDYDEQTTETPIIYRLYTEDKVGLVQLISRYFAGASILDAIGVWQGGTELARIIEIVGVRADLQRIVDLAGDIKVANHQTSVLVTWAPVSKLDV